jgi:hypothetical protein
MARKTPHRAGTPKAGLHLIGDEQSFGRVHQRQRGLQEPRRIGENPVGREDIPSEEKILSTTNAAKPVPAACNSAIAACTEVANAPATSPTVEGASTSRTCAGTWPAENDEGEIAVTAAVLP